MIDPCTERVLVALTRAYADTVPFELDAMIQDLDACWSAIDNALHGLWADDNTMENAKRHLAAFEQFARMLRNTIEKAEGSP